MKTLFDINTEQSDSESHVLLLEIGTEHCSYGYFDKEAQRLDRIAYHRFDALELETSFGRVAEDLKGSRFQKIVVASAFPEAILVPHKYAEGSERWLNALYLQRGSKHLRDRIAEWQIHTTYAVPAFIYNRLHREFQTPEFYHHYTTTIRQHPSNGDAHLLLHFNSSAFSVLVRQGGQVLLAQTYSYATPLDVVYYLLKICEELKLSQTEVVPVLSGLLEKHSALYNQLQQYFLNIRFAEASAYALPSEEHPSYYFQSLFNLAACVS